MPRELPPPTMIPGPGVTLDAKLDALHKLVLREQVERLRGRVLEREARVPVVTSLDGAPWRVPAAVTLLAIFGALHLAVWVVYLAVQLAAWLFPG